MKQIFDFFKPQREQDLFETRKTTMFIIVGIIGLLLILLRFINEFTSEDKNFILNMISISSLGIFILASLFILKKTNIRIAGNVLSFGIVFILAAVVNSINPQISIFYKFLGGFYILLGLYSLSVLFATQKIIIINALIILLSTTRVYLFALAHIQSPKQIELIKLGYQNHVIALILIFMIYFFTDKFVRAAIQAAQRDAKIKDDQNIVLRKIVEGIKESSSQIYKTGSQLSLNSQQISSNANEQAASTEEISASMEEILAMVSTNAENAETTAKITRKSADEMKESSEVFMKTIEAVSQISQKIAIITEIAGKTDILSINAAIEAARTGEGGKGFAVVAQEIKKLADKTKRAAIEINELSINGQKISEIAGERLKKAIPDIVQSAELVNDIVAASREQKTGIASINNSVLQLTEIANESSASAEEMSASSENLVVRAKQLRTLIRGMDTGGLQKEEALDESEKIVEQVQISAMTVKQENDLKIDLRSSDELDNKFEQY